jgi:nucleotide-binding universal stress UspA family protein
MFDKVMLAMDMSERTDDLLTAFYSLCPNTDTEVFLLHVAENEEEQGMDSAYYKRTFSQLDGYVSDLNKAGYDQVSIVWRYNPEPLNGIMGAAVGKNVDLLCLVSHGKGRLESTFGGSTTFDVARSSLVPLLIVKEAHARDNYLQRILVPTDFSKKSLDGLKVIRALHDHVGEVVFVHVLERFRSEDELRVKTEAAQNMLQEMVDEMAPFGIKSRFLIEQGMASKEICRLAEVEKCTLICTSKTGAGLVKGLLMGSTTQNVVLQTPCSLLIMPGQEEE